MLGVPSPELSLSSLGSRMVALNVAAAGGGSGAVADGDGGGGETESPFMSLTSSSHTRFSLQHEWWAEPIVLSWGHRERTMSPLWLRGGEKGTLLPGSSPRIHL